MARRDSYVLVTGANGLIGTAICELFHKSHVKFVALHREPSRSSSNWETAVSDLARDGIKDVPAEIDTVFHCAARIPKSASDFQSCAESNKVIDDNLAKFLVDRKIRKLVFASTTNLYGLSTSIISEDSEPQIENAYAQAKLESEKMFSRIRGLSAYCLRINAPYGPRQTHETVLSSFIRKAMANETILYHGGGARCQDFTNVQDVADAFLKCLQTEGSGGVYNISLGDPISMKSLAGLILSLLPESTSQVLPSNQPDPQEHHRARFKLAKARQDLGWSAKISLREGISDWVSRIAQ